MGIVPPTQTNKFDIILFIINAVCLSVGISALTITLWIYVHG